MMWSMAHLEDILLGALEVLEPPLIHSAIHTSGHQLGIIWQPGQAPHLPIVSSTHTTQQCELSGMDCKALTLDPNHSDASCLAWVVRLGSVSIECFLACESTVCIAETGESNSFCSCLHSCLQVQDFHVLIRHCVTLGVVRGHSRRWQQSCL